MGIKIAVIIELVRGKLDASHRALRTVLALDNITVSTQHVIII